MTKKKGVTLLVLSFIGGALVHAGSLHDAVRSNDVSCLLKALEQGEEVNAKDDLGYTALHRAADRNPHDVITHLKKSGAIKDVLYATSWWSHGSKTDKGNPGTHYFLAQPNNPSRFWMIGPMTSILYKDTDLAVVRALLNAKADPNVKNEEGDTALHLAVRQKYPGIAVLLVMAKADINVLDREGKTPLIRCARNISYFGFEDFIRAWSITNQIPIEDIEYIRSTFDMRAPGKNCYLGVGERFGPSYQEEYKAFGQRKNAIVLASQISMALVCLIEEYEAEYLDLILDDEEDDDYLLDYAAPLSPLRPNTPTQDPGATAQPLDPIMLKAPAAGPFQAERSLTSVRQVFCLGFICSFIAKAFK